MCFILNRLGNKKARTMAGLMLLSDGLVGVNDGLKCSNAG